MKTGQAVGFRADIQGLRAIAVLLVLVFHLWPKAVQGGYVGVDVFFVISGYLITGQLFRELSAQGRIALGSFYERRVRRLLPAASLTLVAVAAGARVWLPKALWKETAKEIFASAFYVENLLLVRKSVDYLSLDAEPSPVQHYWSLSVEEQFYILWPLMIIAVGAIAARSAKANLSVLLRGALALLCLASFGAALYYSVKDSAPGYFLTTTRLWELGLGGLLALMPAESLVPGRLASLLGWVGLCGILASGSLYTVTLPFPGYYAVLPTVSAALLIAARVPERSWLGKLLGLPSMQYFGEISYSLYLWHWPVIAAYPYVVGRNIEYFADRVTIAAVSVGFAHFSKVFVEDRFRHAQPELPRVRVNRGLLLGVATTSLVAIGATVLVRSAPKPPPPVSASARARKYPGAEAFVRNLEVPPVKQFLPSAETATLDRGPAYGTSTLKTCIGDVDGSELAFCSYGPKKAPFHVVLIGDSHSVHWLPAFESLATRNAWRIDGLTKSRCVFGDVTIIYGSAKGKAALPNEDCRAWGENVLDWLLKERPDLVILSMARNYKLGNGKVPDSQAPIAQGIVRMTQKLKAAGIPVGAIKHTPWQRTQPPACMSRPDSTVLGCSSSRAESLKPPGFLELASRLEPWLKLLTFDDAFCRNDLCPVVIGNVFVYRDAHHITATFASTLSAVLDERIKKAFPTAR
jgi:peptidoglycan/LPS O-acetylase OafA/YrhL